MKSSLLELDVAWSLAFSSILDLEVASIKISSSFLMPSGLEVEVVSRRTAHQRSVFKRRRPQEVLTTRSTNAELRNTRLRSVAESRKPNKVLPCER